MTIFSKLGQELPKTRIIYTRKHPRLYFDNIPVTYSFVDSLYNQYSNVTFANNFHAMLKTFANEGCLVSKLLLNARVWQNYVNKKHVNYVSCRETKGLISFTPYGKTIQLTEDNKWSRVGRQTCKPARFAREFLNPRLTKRLNDKHFALFATKFKTFEDVEELIFERSIFPVAYNDDNYTRETGSCMTKKNVDSFYSKFSCYPLVARRKVDRKLVGRAIIWDDVELISTKAGHSEIVSDNVFMDRIYANTVECQEAFLQYANNHGMLHRSANRGDEFRLGDTRYSINDFFLKTKPRKGIKLDDISEYPYIDTFRYGDYEDKFIMSRWFDCYSRFSYDRTSMSRQDNGYQKGYVKSYHGSYVHPDTCVFYDNVYFEKTCSYVIVCEDDKQHYYYRDDRLVKINEKHYLKSNSVTCAYSGNYILKHEAVKVYTSTGDEKTVHKKYASLYYSEPPPKKIDKVGEGYKFKLGDASRSELNELYKMSYYDGYNSIGGIDEYVTSYWNTDFGTYRSTQDVIDDAERLLAAINNTTLQPTNTENTL